MRGQVKKVMRCEGEVKSGKRDGHFLSSPRVYLIYVLFDLLRGMPCLSPFSMSCLFS